MLKILRTRVAGAEEAQAAAATRKDGAGAGDAPEVAVTKDGVMLPCEDGSVLVATHVQVPGKKACTAADLANGFVGKRMFLAGRE